MVSHSKNYYLEQMSLEAKKVVLSILLKKTNHTQLKRDVAEYYKLRNISDEKAVAE